MKISKDAGAKVVFALGMAALGLIVLQQFIAFAVVTTAICGVGLLMDEKEADK